MEHQAQPAAAAAKRGRRKSGGDSLKVVYISSPMKVKTSATRFRSLVQELTGKNSDIARYMDCDGGGGGAADFRDQDGTLLRNDGGGGVLSSVSSDDTTTTNTTAATAATTSADSFLDDNYAAASRMADQFAGFFSSESFCDVVGPDVLGSYHDLLM